MSITARPWAPAARARAIAALTIIVGIAVSVGPSPAAHAKSDFSDVAQHHQFHREITWMADEGITTGFADGSFQPRAPISRVAFAAFLYRLAGEPSGYALGLQWWLDVERGHQFFREVAWVSEQRITRGFTNSWGVSEFRPEENISREAVAAFLYRYQGSPRFKAP
ncbi:MAG: S-layer homology domain-containing protein [Demequina sp.]|uniref:S-layer homology domain-containing protein n=1 Tax=Demequina sp. TaxID=2050685 RepID=UPI003A8BF854